MTTLTPIHLRALERPAALYGEAAVHDALAVATAARNFNARAIERLLARAHPRRPRTHDPGGDTTARDARGLG
jgi:hypothetical protein